MMNAEMASETSRSRAQTATTGSGRAPVSFGTAGIGGWGLGSSGIVFLFYLTFCCCQALDLPRTNNATLFKFRGRSETRQAASLREIRCAFQGLGVEIHFPGTRPIHHIFLVRVTQRLGPPILL